MIFHIELPLSYLLHLCDEDLAAKPSLSILHLQLADDAELIMSLHAHTYINIMQ